MSAAPRAFASFLAATLVLVPLPGHWRARNVPTLSLITWLFILNVAHGVNVIEWYDNTEIKLKIWCDIISKLVIGANMAIPAACFCLALRLEGIAAVRNVKTLHTSKRRRMLVDIAICVGLPLIQMALHYVVQGHRFDIVERFGCQPEDYISLPEFFLVWFIPILLCICTFVLGGLSFLHFFKRRATFARHLAASNTGLTPSRYFRLMAMSLALMIWNLLIFSLTLFFDYRNGLRPWTSWADVHSNWQHINRFPVVLIPADTLRWTYFLWWATPVTAYMFFAFFVFGQDTLSEYTLCVTWFNRKVLRRTHMGAGAQSIKDRDFFKPIRSLPSQPSQFETGMHSSQPDKPYVPTTTGQESWQLSYLESPVTPFSAPAYVPEHDKEKTDDVTNSPMTPSTDDPVPPYHLPSPPTPTIVSPPLARVAHDGHDSTVSQYADSDCVV